MATQWQAAVAVVAAAAVVSACTSDPGPSPAPVPVIVAEPVPLEGTGLAPEPTLAPTPPGEPAGSGTATDEPEPTAPPSPSEDRVGPASSDAAAFLASDALADVHGLEHVVVDLDGDTWPEVVTAGMRDLAGLVHVAWWTDDGYEVLARGVAGRGRGVTDLRAADVNNDSVTELLVVVQGEGLRSMALWAVPRRGQLQPLEAVGGCNDGSHVYGVTVARLEAQGDAPPVIVGDCDESPLPVADWSEHRWAWEDGAYRHQRQVPPGPPDDNPGRGGDGDAGDRGRGDGGDEGDGNAGGGNQGGGNQGGDD